jgi:ubiquinone/menaquinone biosynthesis C-methylase UbiE
MDGDIGHADVVSEHYQTWAARNVNSWVLSDSYFNFWAKQIIDLLALESSDRICDLGAGNGRLASQMADTVNPSVPLACIEPNFAVQDGESRGRLRREKVSAEDYLERCKPDSLDKILIKQAIHHLTRKPQAELAKVMFRILAPEGRILILTMPPAIQYPTFAAVRDEFEKYQVDFTGLENNFTDAGFIVAKGYRDFPVRISKQSYFEAIRARYISDLAGFTEAEIEDGIREIMETYGNPDNYEFADRLCYFLMSKPKA